MASSLSSSSSLSKDTNTWTFDERLSFARQELDPSSGITDLLQIQEVFTSGEVEEIISLDSKLNQSTALLSAVVNKGPDACTKFIEALEKVQPSLAECIRKYGKANENSVLENLAVVTKALTTSEPVSPQGTVLTSTIVPAAQLALPVGAVMKSLTMRLEVTPVPENFSNAKFGDQVTFGPLVAIEPRRRKFHKALTLKLPLQTWTTSEHDVRLMCCTAAPSQPTTFRDFTDEPSVTMKIGNGRLIFTTTLSALFWPIIFKTPVSKYEAETIADDHFEEASTRYLTSILLGSCQALWFNEAPPPTYEEAMAYIAPRSSFICTACKKHVETLAPTPPEPRSKKPQIDAPARLDDTLPPSQPLQPDTNYTTLVDYVITAIQHHHLTPNQLHDIAVALRNNTQHTTTAQDEQPSTSTS